MTIGNFVSLIELATLMIAVVCIVLAALHKANDGQKLTLTIAFLVSVISLGCLGANLSADEALLVFATKIEYLGASNFFPVFTILYAQYLDIHIPKWLKISMFAVGYFFTALILTFDCNHLYYDSYKVQVIDTIPKLVKEYTPLHTVYVAVSAAYMLSYLAMFAYRRYVTRRYKNHYPFVLLVVGVVPTAFYVLEKVTGSIISLLPFGLIIADVHLVYLISNRYYALNSIALDVVYETSADAVVVENSYHEFEGANTLAREMFPGLNDLTEGASLEEISREDGCSLLELMSMPDDDSTDGENYQFKRHQYKMTHQEIWTKNKKNLIGRILTLNDITAEAAYESFLVSYKEELELEVEQKTAEVQQAQDQMLLGFASLVENRNMVTGGHIRRTSAYVEAIGKELMLEGIFPHAVNETYLKRLVRVAPLHDLGKISISEAILDKPGKLTAEEFEQMKRHTVNGAKILDTVLSGSDRQDYNMGREITLYHHEKWDGSGYPEGLVKTEIPLSARIMAVADVFDALTSERPYKRAYTLTEAFQIMQEGRGTHFDAAILDAFMNIKEEIEEIYRQVGTQA